MHGQKNIILDEYEISPNIFQSLLYYCRDYNATKSMLRISYLPSTPGGERSPSRPIGDVSDPTFAAYMRIEKLAKRVDNIESAAKEADSLLYEYILANATNGTTYDQFTPDRPPCNRSEFYKARRKFYYILAQKLGYI